MVGSLRTLKRSAEITEGERMIPACHSEQTKESVLSLPKEGISNCASEGRRGARNEIPH
jgi:hypothetical protein